MKEGDIVRIVKQPSFPTGAMGSVGWVGFVEKVNDARGTVQFQSVEGNGSGSVPIDCLVIETDPKWRHAQANYDEEMRQIRERSRREHEVMNPGLTIPKAVVLPWGDVAVYAKIEGISYERSGAGWVVQVNMDGEESCYESPQIVDESTAKEACGFLALVVFKGDLLQATWPDRFTQAEPSSPTDDAPSHPDD